MGRAMLNFMLLTGFGVLFSADIAESPPAATAPILAASGTDDSASSLPALPPPGPGFAALAGPFLPEIENAIDHMGLGRGAASIGDGSLFGIPGMPTSRSARRPRGGSSGSGNGGGGGGGATAARAASPLADQVAPNFISGNMVIGLTADQAKGSAVPEPPAFMLWGAIGLVLAAATRARRSWRTA